ncbi:hypothetical protein QFZ84_005758 [Pseudomonas fluorescens]
MLFFQTAWFSHLRLGSMTLSANPMATVVWLDNREVKQLARLQLRITNAPEHCPADRPLELKLNNGNDVPLTELC